MASVDVTVRGGGIFGLACAWACARRGARVRLVEAVAVGAGPSGGVVGALAPHAPEGWNPLKEFQFESLVMAEAWWAQVAAAGGGDPGYARPGRLQPLADAAAVEAARARAGAARDLWRGLAEWAVVPATGAGWAPASPSGFLIHDTLSARIAPRAALAALLAALRARGGEVVTGEVVTGEVVTGGAVTGGAAEEGAVIHATGLAGLEALSAAFARRLGSGVKGQAARLSPSGGAVPPPGAPLIQAPGLFVVPHGDGTVAVGSTAEREWVAEGPDARLEEVIARARALVPALAQAQVIERWAGIRPRAASRQPVLGAWPGRPGHFIANGGFKLGFGLAPRVGEEMAALVLEGRDAIPEPFRPEALLA